MTRQALAIGIALVVTARPVLAQRQGSAPAGGLFGSSGAAVARSQLDLIVAVSEGLDSAAPPELGPGLPQVGPPVVQGGLQPGGYSSMLLASADYERRRRSVQVTATGFAAFRRYQQLDQASMSSHSAALGAAMSLPRRSTFDVNQTVAYSPSYFYGMFPTVAPPGLGEAVPPAQDYRVDDQKSLNYITTATWAAGSPRGNRVSVSAERNWADFLGETRPRQDLDTLSGRAKWERGIGRTGFFSTGYEYRVGEFEFGGDATEQRVRIGAGYSPALSNSRRVALQFGIAPTVFDSATGTRHRVEADASANYPFMRGWSIGGSYSRGVDYVPGLLTPIFRDSTLLELTGLVTRRLDVYASTGRVVGQSAVTSGIDNFETYLGNVRARYAVSRSFAVYAEYLYYSYDRRGQLALAPDLPAVYEQQGVRVGVMFWARPVGR